MSAHPTAVVFLGPSLPSEEAHQIFPEVEIKPPIKRGDLDALIGTPPSIIGIIDGLLFQAFAVSPKEVLRATRAGSLVYGAASIGALRAVELERFGMRGVGHVFDLYRSGTIDADDEVAMAYTADGSKGVSDALVSIRHGLQIAADRGLITPEQMRCLASFAKRLYFPERSWQALLGYAEEVLRPAQLEALTTLIVEERPDIKRRDAIELLETISRLFHEQLLARA